MATKSPARWRRTVARVLTVLGALLLLVSAAANLVEREALDSRQFEQTAEELLASPVIQERVAASLTDRLFASVDVRAELEAALPEDQKALAGPIAGALRPVAERLAREIIERPRFQEAWVTAVGAAHAQAIRVLEDETRFVSTEGGVVSLDLRPLLQELAERLPVAANLEERVPENAAVIALFRVDQLDAAQDGTRVLRAVADWLWVLVLLVWAGAVYLAPNRRGELRAVAISFLVVGLLLLLGRRLGGGYVVDELAAAQSDEEVVRMTWDITTELVVEAGRAAIAIGLIALAGVWLVGPGSRAAAARARLAPYLRNAWLTYGVAAFLALLLLVWGPLEYLERPLVVVVLAVLATLGIEIVRRRALSETD